MTHRIGIFESLTAGCHRTADNLLPDNFLDEGYAMVQAIQNWFSASPKSQAIAFLHNEFIKTLQPKSHFISLQASTECEIVDQTIELYREHALDQLVVIAPECDGELLRLIAAFEAQDVRTWNCSQRFIQLASDKWAFACQCASMHIPHPNTRLLSTFLKEDHTKHAASKVVLKPRDGAGCIDLWIFENEAIGQEFVLRHTEKFRALESWIVQDWVEGIAASRSILVNREQVFWLPWMSQEFCKSSIDNENAQTLEYNGARRLANVDNQVGQETIAALIDGFKGELQGWIGFDFVLPIDEAVLKTPTLIELNPRFTTSFVHLEIKDLIGLNL